MTEYREPVDGIPGEVVDLGYAEPQKRHRKLKLYYEADQMRAVACSVRPAAAVLFQELKLQCNLAKGAPVACTAKLAQRVGISRRHRLTLLDELADAGWITLTKRRRKAPLVDVEPWRE